MLSECLKKTLHVHIQDDWFLFKNVFIMTISKSVQKRSQPCGVPQILWQWPGYFYRKRCSGGLTLKIFSLKPQPQENTEHMFMSLPWGDEEWFTKTGKDYKMKQTVETSSLTGRKQLENVRHFWRGEGSLCFLSKWFSWPLSYHSDLTSSKQVNRCFLWEASSQQNMPFLNLLSSQKCEMSSITAQVTHQCKA